jgi:spermidine synthase
VPRAHSPRLLYAIVFVVGAASLGAEIAAARLLAPFFGASTIVWANTIATVLLALSVGYWLGGRLADRKPSVDRLCWLVVAAAVLLALVPIAARPLLPLAADALDSVSAGGFLASLAAVLVLVAVPVLLLGTVSPYALRLSVQSVEHAGAVAGRLYAVSTLGSLTGTFAAALLLVPFAGTRRTFAIFALLLLAVTLPRLRLRALAAAAVPLLTLAIAPGTIKTTSGERVLFETETPYQYARVMLAADGSRRLELNEGQAVHSLRRPGSYLTGLYWDDLLLAPLATTGREPGSVAILGNAGGTVARAFGHFFPRTLVDAVEIDGELTRIGRRYFGLAGPRLRTITADARPFLRRPGRRYDAILVDAYRQPYIPFYLTTREFFQEAAARLDPGGTVVINVGHPPGSRELERTLAATMGSVFGHVVADDATEENTILVASDRPPAGSGPVPAALASRVAALSARLRPAASGGEMYTDDRAPVEWLVDGSLLNYAGGGGG